MPQQILAYKTIINHYFYVDEVDSEEVSEQKKKDAKANKRMWRKLGVSQRIINMLSASASQTTCVDPNSTTRMYLELLVYVDL